MANWLFAACIIILGLGLVQIVLLLSRLVHEVGEVAVVLRGLVIVIRERSTDTLESGGAAAPVAAIDQTYHGKKSVPQQSPEIIAPALKNPPRPTGGFGSRIPNP